MGGGGEESDDSYDEYFTDYSDEDLRDQQEEEEEQDDGLAAPEQQQRARRPKARAAKKMGPVLSKPSPKSTVRPKVATNKKTKSTPNYKAAPQPVEQSPSSDGEGLNYPKSSYWRPEDVRGCNQFSHLHFLFKTSVKPAV